MKAENLINCAVLDPGKARKLVRALDETWRLLPATAADPRAIESFRLELATIMLALAQGDRREMEAIKKSAIRLN